jgi:hypothetical protein
MTTPPPGWYPDASMGARFWDGTKWIDVPQPPPPQTAHVVVSGPNHALHFVLTLLTCGLWLPIWLLIALDNKQQVTRIDAEGRIIQPPFSSKAVALRVLLFIVVVTVIIVILVNLGK